MASSELGLIQQGPGCYEGHDSVGPDGRKLESPPILVVGWPVGPDVDGLFDLTVKPVKPVGVTV